MQRVESEEGFNLATVFYFSVVGFGLKNFLDYWYACQSRFTFQPNNIRSPTSFSPGAK